MKQYISLISFVYDLCEWVYSILEQFQFISIWKIQKWSNIATNFPVQILGNKNKNEI